MIRILVYLLAMFAIAYFMNTWWRRRKWRTCFWRESLLKWKTVFELDFATV